MHIKIRKKMLLFLGILFLFPLLYCQKAEPGNNNIEEPKEVEPGLPEIFLTGSKQDKKSTPKAGFLLAGGGSDVDEAMRWLAQNANGGDIVVLRATGGDGYNNYLFSSLGVSLNSVRTLVVDTREKANKDSVDKYIRNAEALFIAGGDQSTYLTMWKGTKIESAIRYLIKEKRATIGGTSAGMALMSNFVYSGELGSVTSEVAILNPYDSKITIHQSFIEIDLLKDYITDTHFSERARFGRAITFLSRIAYEYKRLPKAIACDEYSAVCIEPDGTATIYGKNAFFIESLTVDNLVCSPATPLSWMADNGAIRYKKIRGDLNGSVKISLSGGSADGYKWNYINVDKGVIKELEN